ncbi:nitrogen fixation protein NifZ [Magnetofaba australis]|uniref:Putative NifZ family protein n=1 Tax=Magnetofaba australis IT-1 TaxID=1434232 RepID=A0A1Y2K3Q7_9PROT|nr:nitrogen fixation protein NifZ [Magnetofaba australis]OSM04025.1 putative NifZ family protein [Magnetofaba australis IT-1]
MDMIDQKFEYGQQVRLIRAIRNDGTFPGRRPGEKLAPRGALGYVRNVGTFLQDQVIYEVHFIDMDLRVGCREQELQDAEEPWVETVFDKRDRVMPIITLARGEEVLVAEGEVGEVEEIHDENPEKVAYTVQFGERHFRIPERALTEAPEIAEERRREYTEEYVGVLDRPAPLGA